MNIQRLELSDSHLPVPNLDRYSLRWTRRLDGGYDAVLYHDGHRVVQSWRLWVEADVPADVKGTNANTT